MATEIVKQLTPEEEELVAKRKELTRLESELADRELTLANLKAELAAFEGLYLRRVGFLYAELDEWNARTAELYAEEVSTPESKSEAASARSQAQESYSAAHGEAAEVQPFISTPELKSLYREAAKQLHPDTAVDEKDRARRERLMKDVNGAYAAGDEEALRRILLDLHNSPDSVQGSGVGADLIRVLRQLRQVRNRIGEIDMEITTLSISDVAKLKAKADAAGANGSDLLTEMATRIQGQIGVAKQRFTSKKERSRGK